MPGRLFFRNLVERRSLLYQLVRRDFERRFVGSAGGWLWGMVQPLVLLLSWTFVFHVCLKVEVPPGQGTDNYTLFLFCGYLPWMLFQETALRASTSLLESPNLITKTVFPSEMIPISVFLSSLLNHLMTLTLAIAAVAIWAHNFNPGLLILPVYMLLLGLFAVGFGWIVSAFQVYLRDTAQVLLVLITLWFWVTPIFITVEQVPDRLQFLPALNPLTALVQAYRGLLLTNATPDWNGLAYLALCSVGMFVLGGLVFRQLKRGFADVM